MERPEDGELPILTDVVELRSSTGSTGLHALPAPARTEDLGLHSAEELAALQADLVSRALESAPSIELLDGVGHFFHGNLGALEAAVTTFFAADFDAGAV